MSTYLGDASDHVLDKRFEGVDSASLLVASEPHAKSKIGALSFIAILFYFLDFNSQVREVFLDFTSLTLHSYFSSIAGNLNYQHARLKHKSRSYHHLGSSQILRSKESSFC